MTNALTFPWDTFLQLQAFTDTRIVNARSHAREEALTQLLEEVAAGEGPSDPDAMRRRYWTLTGNRAKKHRHRATVEDQVIHHQRLEHQRIDSADLAAVREVLALAGAGLPAEDRDLLQAVLGNGIRYCEIAIELGKPVGTVKARISRLRRKIRDGHGGRIFQLAMVAA